MKSIECKKLYIYAPAEYGIALPTSFDKDGNILTTSSYAVCRESVLSYFIRLVTGKAAKKHSTRFNLQLFCKSVSIEDAEKGLAVINSLEDSVGISRTVIKCVESANAHGNGYMFNASIKWARAVPTLSMYLLLVKEAIREATMFGANKVTDFKSFKKTVLSKALFLTEPVSPTHSNDRNYLRRTIHLWELILNNLDVVFPADLPIAKRFSTECVFNGKVKLFMNTFGIDRYINTKNTYRHRDKFLALAKEAGIKIN